VSVRVLLVDDQPLLRQGYRMVLSAQDDLEVVGEAADGAAAVRAAHTLRPDVVLMDVRMPGMDGIEATRQIVQQTPDVRVIILTTFDVDQYAFSALRAGASGFLLKNVPPDDLALRHPSGRDRRRGRRPQHDPPAARRLRLAPTGRAGPRGAT